MATNETRDKIVTTAAELLERQGYHATGLNEIVKASGTPRGSLYYYFPEGKEELASEAVRRRMGEMAEKSRELLSQIDDPIEAIHAMIVEMSKSMAAHGCESGAPIATVALEASNTSERIRHACSDGYLGLRDVLAAKLASGAFPAELADSLAVTIQAAIEGGFILSRTHQDASILVGIADDMQRLLDLSSPQ